MEKVNVYDLPFMKKEGALEKLVEYLSEHRYSAIGISKTGRICQCEDVDNGMKCSECIFEDEPVCEWGLLKWMFVEEVPMITVNERKLLETLDYHYSIIRKKNDKGIFEVVDVDEGAVVETCFDIYEDVNFGFFDISKDYYIDELLKLKTKEEK